MQVIDTELSIFANYRTCTTLAVNVNSVLSHPPRIPENSETKSRFVVIQSV